MVVVKDLASLPVSGNFRIHDVHANPWPNGLAIERTQVKNLGLLATAFGHASRSHVMTCAHLSRDQIFAQVDASFSPLGHQAQVNAS